MRRKLRRAIFLAMGAFDKLPLPMSEVKQQEKLLDVTACMAALWDDDSRPSERWFRQLAADRQIPSVLVGRRRFYAAADVRRALDARFKIEAL